MVVCFNESKKFVIVILLQNLYGIRGIVVMLKKKKFGILLNMTKWHFNRRPDQNVIKSRLVGISAEHH